MSGPATTTIGAKARSANGIIEDAAITNTAAAIEVLKKDLGRPRILEEKEAGLQ